MADDAPGPDTYFYAPPDGASKGGSRVFRVPMHFASSASGAGSAGSVPPPPPGAGSNDDGSGDGGVAFGLKQATSFNVDEVERLFRMKRMASAEAFGQSIVLDLAELHSEVDQLRYLDGVAKTVNEYVHSGNNLGFGAMVEVLDLITAATDDITKFITPERVDDKVGAGLSTVIMRRIIGAADHLERFLLASDSMDRGTAERLARIYFIAAVKGSGCDAVMARLSLGVNSPAYRAHVGRTVLQLIDVKERFEQLGREDDARDVTRVLTSVIVHHGFTPDSQRRALDSVLGYLREKIEGIYRNPADEKLDREADFLRNLRYLLDGNRRFGPMILFNCAEIFFEMNDQEKRRMFTKWGADDNRLSDRHARI
jgi:hypothetical protein